MIDISQHGGIFGGSKGSKVVGVQHFKVSFNAGVSKLTIPIERVRKESSIVLINGRGYGRYTARYYFIGYFKSDNEVIVERGAGRYEDSADVYFSVIEFQDVVSKQDGYFYPPASSGTYVLNFEAVDISRALIVMSAFGTTGGSSNSSDYIYGITSKTTAEIYKFQFDNIIQYYWQLIEFR